MTSQPTRPLSRASKPYSTSSAAPSATNSGATAPSTPTRTPEQLVERARAAVAILRETLAEAPAGPWSAEWESCDCGDGYGCRHGAYVTGIWFAESIMERDPGEEPREYDRRGSTEIPAAAVQLACLMGPDASTAVADLLDGYVISWDRSAGEAREILAGTDSWIRAVAPIVDAILKVCCPDCLTRWDVYGGPGWCCPAATPAEVYEDAGR